jgi:hypothetical protein
MIAEIEATRRPGQLGGKARQKREDMGKKTYFVRLINKTTEKATHQKSGLKSPSSCRAASSHSSKVSAVPWQCSKRSFGDLDLHQEKSLYIYNPYL